MTSLWSFLLAAVGPLAIRALTAIGFTAVTFTGVQAVVNALVTHAQDAWATLPATALQLASLMGAPEGLGLVLGAVVARLTMWVGANGTKLLFTGKLG